MVKSINVISNTNKTYLQFFYKISAYKMQSYSWGPVGHFCIVYSGHHSMETVHKTSRNSNRPKWKSGSMTSDDKLTQVNPQSLLIFGKHCNASRGHEVCEVVPKLIKDWFYRKQRQNKQRLKQSHLDGVFQVEVVSSLFQETFSQNWQSLVTMPLL